MPSSDLPLTRRQALAAGAGGVALLFTGPLRGGAAGDVAEAASATCVMTPEKTEGPYFVDEALNRSDIRASKDGSGLQPGAPLALTMYVFDATADCAPVAGAQVDVWHANAAGEYSDVAQNGTDAMNAQVFAGAPYSGRGTADTLDTGDGIYGTDGSSLLLRPTSDGAGGAQLTLVLTDAAGNRRVIRRTVHVPRRR